jgi:hypothetical protein
VLHSSFVKMIRYFGVIVIILIVSAALVWGLAHV